MTMQETLIDLVNCHNFIQEKGKDEVILEEIEGYVSSTFTPVSQLARAIKQLGTGEENTRTRPDLLIMLQQHDALRKTIMVVSAEEVSEEGQYEASEDFKGMLENYRAFKETVKNMKDKNKGDNVILDVVMESSLGDLRNSVR